VRAVRSDLAGLAARIRTPGPIRPQGMALVVLLLSDVEQPLYGVGTPEELSAAIIYSTQRLDP
jgi:hypothetical protein